VRLLLFSDLHLDAPSTDMSKDDMRAAFRRICELVRSLGVDAVCGAGNLYDNADVAPDTAEVLRSGFAAISPIPVFLAPGSSDYLSPDGPYRAAPYQAAEWSGNVHVFTEPHLAGLTVATGITLWGAAHVQPVHPVGFLGTGELRNAGVNIALFHGCERSEFVAQHVDGQITAPFHAHQIRESGLDHALVGHLPMPRATAEYTYPGQPAPHDPSGPARGGAALVTVHSDGSVQQEWYDLFEHAAFLWVKTPETPPRSETRVTADRPAATVDFAKQASVAVAEVREEPLDAPDFPESTVRGQFVRSVLRSELNRDDRRRVLAMGLAALNGHADFGEM
jgi:exonuclease SbcD